MEEQPRHVETIGHRVVKAEQEGLGRCPVLVDVLGEKDDLPRRPRELERPLYESCDHLLDLSVTLVQRVVCREVLRDVKVLCRLPMIQTARSGTKKNKCEARDI